MDIAFALDYVGDLRYAENLRRVALSLAASYSLRMQWVRGLGGRRRPFSQSRVSLCGAVRCSAAEWAIGLQVVATVNTMPRRLCMDWLM